MKTNKISSKYYVACSKGFFAAFFILTILLTTNFVLPPTFAADATSTAKQASPSGSLMDKLSKLKEEIASRAASLRSEISQKLQNKAIWGLIERIDGETFTVSMNGQTRSVQANEYSQVQSTVKNSAKLVTIKLKDLEEGEFISVLGDVDDKNTLNAKRIIKSTAIASDSTKLVWGTVESSSGNALKIKTRDGQLQTIQTDFKTQFWLGQEEGSFSDIKTGKNIIARVSESKEKLFYANYIYLIPQNNSDKPAKSQATISPAITSSPSASPKR